MKQGAVRKVALVRLVLAMMTNYIECASDVDDDGGYFTDTKDDEIVGDVGGDSGGDVK